MLFSFLLSICLNAGLAGLFLLTLHSNREHVFMLVESGEEALEMELGGAFESAAAIAKPPEIAEERAPLLPPDQPPPERTRRFAAAPLLASLLEIPQRAEPAPAPPERPESIPERPRPIRLQETPPPESFAPERPLPLPEADDAPARTEEAPETRFAELPPDVAPETVPDRPETAIADPAAVPSPSPSPLPERETIETADAPLERPHHRRRETRNDPDAAERPAPAAAEASNIGSQLRIQGVPERAKPVPALVPRYPNSSRQRGESGVVRVRALITIHGRCLRAEIEGSSGYAALDKAALDAVRRASYMPSRIDGVPTEAEEVFLVDFRLQ